MAQVSDILITELPERKFGIELEVIDVNTRVLQEVVRTSLRNNGLGSRRVELERYMHDGPDNTSWKWKPDSSCGHELTSPVLQGWAGLRELNIVTDAVDSWATANRKRLVNRSCGVHVHVDCRDFEWTDVKNLAITMKIWEPLFYAMNPHSRNGNRQCAHVQFLANKMKLATSRSDVKDAWESTLLADDSRGLRYHGLNLEPWWSRGSVEYRYFSGTWAFEKAAAAVMICLLTTQAIKHKETVTISDYQLRRSFESLWYSAGKVGLIDYTDKFFKEVLGLHNDSCQSLKELKKFIKSRILTFYTNNGKKKIARNTRGAS